MFVRRGVRRLGLGALRLNGLRLRRPSAGARRVSMSAASFSAADIAPSPLMRSASFWSSDARRASMRASVEVAAAYSYARFTWSVLALRRAFAATRAANAAFSSSVIHISSSSSKLSSCASFADAAAGASSASPRGVSGGSAGSPSPAVGAASFSSSSSSALWCSASTRPPRRVRARLRGNLLGAGVATRARAAIPRRAAVAFATSVFSSPSPVHDERIGVSSSSRRRLPLGVRRRRRRRAESLHRLLFGAQLLRARRDRPRRIACSLVAAASSASAASRSVSAPRGRASSRVSSLLRREPRRHPSFAAAAAFSAASRARATRPRWIACTLVARCARRPCPQLDAASRDAATPRREVLGFSSATRARARRPRWTVRASSPRPARPQCPRAHPPARAWRRGGRRLGLRLGDRGRGRSPRSPRRPCHP